MVMGTFVLTYGTAPASRSNLTSAPSAAIGFPTRAEYPMEESQPFTLTRSLSETGTPANGPDRFAVIAQFSADAIITSVKQFV